MWLSVWEGAHQDRSTGESTKPYQSQIIRLGLNTIPNEMAIFYTLGKMMPSSTTGEDDFHENNN